MKQIPIPILAAVLALATPAWAEDPDPGSEHDTKIRAEAEVSFARAKEEIIAKVDVTIHPNADGSIYTIGDWGEAHLDADGTLYLDARAEGPLESFNTKPVHESHEYHLSLCKEAEWKPLEFKTLEHVFEYLQPMERQEVVLRSRAEWHAWAEANWRSDIDIAVADIEVDFETHMLVGVFAGRTVEGSGVEIETIETNGKLDNVIYVEWVADVGPDAEIRYDHPGHLVVVRRSDLPVLFNGRQPEGHGQTWSAETFHEVELVAEWMRPKVRQDVVLRSEAEWKAWVAANYPVNAPEPEPGPPVDFAEFTLVGTFFGEVDQGIGTSITGVSSNGAEIRVDVLDTFPGIQPEDPEQQRPGHMVAIAKTDLKVQFEHDILAFPSPPPGGDDPDSDPALVAAGQEADGCAEGELSAEGSIQVLFRIDGEVHARALLDLSLVVGDPGIPARAEIDIEQTDDEVNAHVQVAFTGAPYHSIAEWGPVSREGNHFILESNAHEIVFIQEPELPYFESHTFALLEAGAGTGDPHPDGEPTEFRRVDSDVQIEKAQNVIIQSTEEWWALIGFEPGPEVRPLPDPVNFEKETLIAVFRGAQPNGCYGVQITAVTATPDGVVQIDYQLRDPKPGEFCTQAIVYPSSLVAIPKNDGPFDFIEHADRREGGDVEIDGEVEGEVEVGGGLGLEAGAAGSIDASLVLQKGERYTVEFRINGRVYAATAFVFEGEGKGGGGGGEEGAIPARASLEIKAGDEGTFAEVEVAFTGAPYHSISDWGPVSREGDLVVLDARASEIVFVQEPDLPYFERHRYRLPVGKPVEGEAVAFEHVETHLQIEERRLLAIQTEADWWALVGFEPGPAVDPVPPPVDLSTHTLIAVFLGERPDTCYGVKIESVVRSDDTLHVAYRLREPRPGEGCGDALTYPASMVAIAKTDLAVEFRGLPDRGAPDENGDIGEEPAVDDGVITVEFRINGEVYARQRHDLTARTGDPNVSIQVPDGFLVWLGAFVPDVAIELGLGAEVDGSAYVALNRDGDRWTDVQEFWLGLDPLRRDEPSGVRPEWIRIDAEGEGESSTHFGLCFQRRKGAESQVDFRVATSADLRTWANASALFEQVAVSDLGGEMEEVTVRLKGEAEASVSAFLRLELHPKEGEPAAAE